MPTTSLTLLDRLKKPGQADAWDRFVSLYTPLLFHWARLQHIHGTDAEDLVQTVLVKLIRLLPRYERGNGETFRGWLFVVCRNECRDFLTRRATRALPITDNLYTVSNPRPADDLDEVEYRRHLVGRALELARRDFSADVWEAFTRLVLHGQKPADVGRELGMTANAIYQARYRVLRRLRTEFDGFLD